MTKHALIDLGVTLLDLATGGTIGQLDLVINIPDGRIWDVNVQKWMLGQPKLAAVVDIVSKEKGYTYQAAMKIFKDFLLSHYAALNGDVVIGGDHIGEDAPWINTYLSMCDYEPLHMIFGELKHPIDIHSYHQGSSRKTHKQVREFSNNGKKFCANIAAFKQFNIKDWSHTGYTHSAVDDSLCIALGHCKVLKSIEALEHAYVPAPWYNSNPALQSVYYR